MKRDLLSYQTFIFDCDGVILNSNKIKTEAFYQTALAYGEAAAEALVVYHIENGGVSRYKKFAYFLNEIVPALARKVSGPNQEVLLEHYAETVLDGLLNCEVVEGLDELRLKTIHANWLIVSGSDQVELRHVFAQRGLDKYFNGGIFGSPDTKEEILDREIKNGNIQQPALFLGDSKYDHKVAQLAGLDFVFLTAWTEVKDWEKWSMVEGIKGYKSINNFLEKW